MLAILSFAEHDSLSHKRVAVRLAMEPFGVGNQAVQVEDNCGNQAKGAYGPQIEDSRRALANLGREDFFARLDPSRSFSYLAIAGRQFVVGHETFEGFEHRLIGRRSPFVAQFCFLLFGEMPGERPSPFRDKNE